MKINSCIYVYNRVFIRMKAKINFVRNILYNVNNFTRENLSIYFDGSNVEISSENSKADQHVETLHLFRFT